MNSYDIAIIGGGINGCGCAADASLRGLNVLLVEANDLASGSSSKSSNLIHGGLRYLEQYDFGLVRKALSERQKLLELAPHLVHPLPFMVPIFNHQRSPIMLRLGLFIYDHLNFVNKLPKTISINAKKNAQYFSALNSKIKNGFLFYDCQTDDARLTVVNALQAKEHGATILTRTQLVSAQFKDGSWQLSLQPKLKDAYQVKSKVVINACGLGFLK